MSLSIDLEADFRGVDSLLTEVINQLDGDSREGLYRIGGTAARNELELYHVGFESASGWENPSLGTHGAGRKKTGFGEEISQGWELGSITSREVEVVNAAPFFAHKVRGGTITAKRVQNLTIPLVPEAHGRTVATYERVTGRPLFRVRNTLCESVNGRVRAVFFLTPRVVHKPWKGALPEESLYLDAFTEAVAREVYRGL